MSLSSFARRLFCRHRNLRFVRNIHGDEINTAGKRSVWACQRCGAVVLRANLHPLPSRIPPAPPAPPAPPRRSHAAAAPAPTPSPPAVYASHDDTPMSMHGLSSLRSEPSPEPAIFNSGGGGDFGGGGSTSSWGDSSSSCSSD